MSTENDIQREIARRDAVTGRIAPTHGLSRTGTWHSFRSMLARCYYAGHDSYKYYGGKGVKVCDRWRDSFENFVADMGVRPPGMTLDRVDSGGDYEPANCRWSTRRTQQANRSSAALVTIDGETACITEWARRAGVSPMCVRHRIGKGITGRALLAPSRRPRRG